MGDQIKEHHDIIWYMPSREVVKISDGVTASNLKLKPFSNEYSKKDIPSVEEISLFHHMLAKRTMDFKSQKCCIQMKKQRVPYPHSCCWHCWI